jgi:hypothetical protein
VTEKQKEIVRISAEIDSKVLEEQQKMIQKEKAIRATSEEAIRKSQQDIVNAQKEMDKKIKEE